MIKKEKSKKEIEHARWFSRNNKEKWIIFYQESFHQAKNLKP